MREYSPGWSRRDSAGQLILLDARHHAYLRGCRDAIAVANFAGSPWTNLTRRPRVSISAMAGKRFIMNAGRTSKQGQQINVGKDNDEYEAIVSTLGIT